VVSAKVNLAVELDGGQHNLSDGKKHDEKRAEYLMAKGIHVLRFWNHDLLGDTDAVLQAMWDMVSRLQFEVSE
jgi:adenine-specific DNA-methyltransferase